MRSFCGFLLLLPDRKGCCKPLLTMEDVPKVQSLDCAVGPMQIPGLWIGVHSAGGAGAAGRAAHDDGRAPVWSRPRRLCCLGVLHSCGHHLLPHRTLCRCSLTCLCQSPLSNSRFCRIFRITKHPFLNAFDKQNTGAPAIYLNIYETCRTPEFTCLHLGMMFV